MSKLTRAKALPKPILSYTNDQIVQIDLHESYIKKVFNNFQ